MNLVKVNCARLFQDWVVWICTTDTPKRNYLLLTTAQNFWGHTRITRQVVVYSGPSACKFLDKDTKLSIFMVCIEISMKRLPSRWYSRQESADMGRRKGSRMRVAGPCTGSDESRLGGCF